MDAKAYTVFLRRLLSRSRLGEDERDAIAALRAAPERIEANRDIVGPGEHRDHACLVVKGLAARFDQMRDGQRQIVAIYVPGDMCDLHSVPVDYTGWGLQTLAPTTIARIAHAELRQAIAQYPDIGMAFWRDTVADGSILAKAVANVGRRRAQPRLAHLLCEMGVRMELAELGMRTAYPLPATQAHLADMLGLTAVHLNRTFRKLKAEGVSMTGGEVRIEDWGRLVRMAEFDPAYLLLPVELAGRFRQ